MLCLLFLLELELFRCEVQAISCGMVMAMKAE